MGAADLVLHLLSPQHLWTSTKGTVWVHGTRHHRKAAHKRTASSQPEQYPLGAPSARPQAVPVASASPLALHPTAARPHCCGPSSQGRKRSRCHSAMLHSCAGSCQGGMSRVMGLLKPDSGRDGWRQLEAQPPPPHHRLGVASGAGALLRVLGGSTHLGAWGWVGSSTRCVAALWGSMWLKEPEHRHDL